MKWHQRFHQSQMDDQQALRLGGKSPIHRVPLRGENRYKQIVSKCQIWEKVYPHKDIQ